MATSHYTWNVNPVLGNLAFTDILLLLALLCAGFLLAYTLLSFLKKRKAPFIKYGLLSSASLLVVAFLLNLMFDFKPIAIPYYGLFFSLGILIAYLIARSLCRERGIDPTHLDDLAFYAVIGLLLGAHVVHLVFYEPQSLINNPQRIFQIGTGLASHGGFLGAVLGGVLYCRRKNIAFLPIADCIAVGVPLTTCCIRLGNFFNSEILGRPSNVPWAVIFTLAEAHPIPRHPVQLYEIAIGLLIFVILYQLFKRQQSRRAPGFFFFLGVLLYFSLRFGAECFKEILSSIEGAEKYLTMGQWLSIPIALIAAVQVFRLREPL